MSHTIKFLCEYLKDRRSIGGVMPSSHYLARLMLRPIDFQRADVIVELGAGTGAITKHLFSRKKPETLLLVFEPHESFAQGLEKKFACNGAYVIRDRAEHLPHYLQQHSIKRADYIISSLPLAGWDYERREHLFSMLSKQVWKGGTYMQYQYFLPTYTRELKEHFREIQLSATLLNVPPPTWMYACWKR